MGFKPDEIERYSITTGDLVICEGGEPGRCAVYSATQPVMYQKALHRVRFWGSLVLPHYAALCFELYAKWQNHMLPSMSQTTIKHLPLEKLLQVVLPVPPLAEQERIISEVDRRLSVVDKLGQVLSTNVQRAERLRQSILQRAFTGKLVPQSPNDEPVSALLERISVSRVSEVQRKKAA